MAVVKPRDFAYSSGMSQPLVSIIVPCYNGESHLAECLQSLFDQSHPNCEIIVIDDGSTDGSLGLLRSYGDRIRVESGPNRGACAARNRGLDLAAGEYVKFFDCDDIMLPDAVAAQVEAMADLAAHEIVYGNTVDLESQQPVFDEIRTDSETTRDEMIEACFRRDIITGCPLHRRQFLLDHHLRFDEALNNGQEWNLHLAIAIAGGIFVYQPIVVYQYRNHESPDRISQAMKDRNARLDCRWHSLQKGCMKIINAYNRGEIPADIHVKMRRRLCKTEASFMVRKMPDEAKLARRIRSQIDPWWRMLFSDIRYIPRRHFAKP